MKTFFCRHSSELDIDHATLTYLWNHDYMAIHYPHDEKGNKEVDSKSLKPNDYAGGAKKAMNAIHNISKEGGYVFVTFEHMDEYKIGFIEPNTPIELISGKWGNKNKLNGREAILKGLKFKQSKIINPINALSLTCAQPRQGTICHWKNVGKRVENYFNNIKADKQLGDLTPDLQEVLCSELMRMDLDKRLPKLECLLTPVGRTMKDVDIIGLTKNGKKVLVQVTYGHQPQWKIDKLQKYKNRNSELILFCKTDKTHIVNDVLVYSIEDAFNNFTSTKKGKEWLISIN